MEGNLAIGEKHTIIGFCRQKFRTALRFLLVLKGLDGVYLANYWLKTALEKIIKKNKSPLVGRDNIVFVIDVLRTTKQKQKEHKIKIV